jgi:PilZ domain-containing protein
METPGLAYYCLKSTAPVALVMPTGSSNPVGPISNRRRSQRVILTLAVTVRNEGSSPKETSFVEETHTLIVNLHGALILLAAKVAKGQTLRMSNRATKDEQLCRVASISPGTEGKSQVGVEFLKPSPDFWRISFPPEDWVLPEPSTVTSND